MASKDERAKAKTEGSGEGGTEAAVGSRPRIQRPRSGFAGGIPQGRLVREDADSEEELIDTGLLLRCL